MKLEQSAARRTEVGPVQTIAVGPVETIVPNAVPQRAWRLLATTQDESGAGESASATTEELKSRSSL
jgi:hypothetical protein